MVAKLVAEEGPLKGAVLSLEGSDEWVVGRDPESSQILIEDPAVSRKHILLKSTPKGILLENLSTTNPAIVNEEEVLESKILSNGDALKIGSGLYRFYIEPAAQLIEDAPLEEPTTSQEIEKEPVMNEALLSPQLQPQDEEEKHDSIFDENAPDEISLAQINFDLPGGGRWVLKVIGGPNNGAEFGMQADHEYTIGTDPNTCDIIFHDKSVSRQQARISISETDELFIEDLKSRNGTLADGEPIKGKQTLVPNALITMGTTTFIVFDREGEMQTIISPLLPSIVKVLQQKEEKKREEEERTAQAARDNEAAIAASKIQETPKETSTALGPLILIGTITGLFVLIGLGTTTLFKSEPVVKQEQVDMDMILQQALSAFPTIKYTFNKNTGNLLLVGHVLRGSDKAQLMYNLQGLKFIRNIDDSGVIIDEYIWREISPIFTRNPAWSSVTIHSPSPGKFVLSGYLQTRKQSEQLWDYLSSNFPYLDLLERKIVVEEDVISAANSALQREGLKDVSVAMSNGELTLSGFVVSGKETEYNKILQDLKAIQGVRDVKSYVTALPPEASIINLSDRYEVTGVSNQGAGNISVVINGHILGRGDVLDGMTITSIKGYTIFLEKDGVKYRIDFSR